MLVRTGDGPVYQVPLTYRDARMSGADEWLLGTTEHSVLGTRWVYDAVGDPVYAAALASAVLGHTGQAEELVQLDDGFERREPSMVIAGPATGDAPVPAVTAVTRAGTEDPTVIVTDAVELTVVRRLGVELTGAVLTGRWPGQRTPVPLAAAR